jgi:hypothetical protein
MMQNPGSRISVQVITTTHYNRHMMIVKVSVNMFSYTLPFGMSGFDTFSPKAKFIGVMQGFRTSLHHSLALKVYECTDNAVKSATTLKLLHELYLALLGCF